MRQHAEEQCCVAGFLLAHAGTPRASTTAAGLLLPNQKMRDAGGLAVLVQDNRVVAPGFGTKRRST